MHRSLLMWSMWVSLRAEKGAVLVPFALLLVPFCCSSSTLSLLQFIGLLALPLNESTFLLPGLCLSLVCCSHWYVMPWNGIFLNCLPSFPQCLGQCLVWVFSKHAWTPGYSHPHPAHKYLRDNASLRPAVSISVIFTLLSSFSLRLPLFPITTVCRLDQLLMFLQNTDFCVVLLIPFFLPEMIDLHVTSICLAFLVLSVLVTTSPWGNLDSYPLDVIFPSLSSGGNLHFSFCSTWL